MEGTMKTAVMTDIMQVEIQERPIPQPKDDEVLVKVEYVGICGSDLHYYESGRIGDFVVKPPFVLGHEAGGTVVEVGANVKNLKVGDRVAMEPGKTCGQCEFCKSGKYNLCEDVVFFATPPVDGVFQEYVAHEEGLCFKLPDNVSTLEGALIEPLAVGMHAARQDRSGNRCRMHRPGYPPFFKSYGRDESHCCGCYGKTAAESIGAGCGCGDQRKRRRHCGTHQRIDGWKRI